jgi:hypothetical protein
MAKKLATLRPSLGCMDGRRVKPPPKVANDIYHSPEYRAWRETVISRAGGRCEIVEDGKRCWRRMPTHRMYADHLVELKDGGAPFDPANGQCKCASHHTAKTAVAKAARR